MGLLTEGQNIDLQGYYAMPPLTNRLGGDLQIGKTERKEPSSEVENGMCFLKNNFPILSRPLPRGDETRETQSVR